MKPKKKGNRKKGSGEKANRKGDNIGGGNQAKCSSPAVYESTSTVSPAAAVSKDVAPGRQSSSVAPAQDSSVPGEESASFKTESKKFARRKIVSNWGRYDSEEDEEARRDVPPPVTRGMNFDDALDASRYVGRQFRFRDELEWDDVDGILDSSVLDSSYDVAQFGVLDLHDLARSLSCIPLHRRLNVDESYFSPELLENFEIDAQTQRSTCESERLSKSETTAYDVTLLEDAAAAAAVAAPSFSRDRHVDKIKNFEDDELDALLNRGPSSSSSSIMNATQEVSFVPEIANKNQERSTVTEKSDHVTSSTSNLEDWLDSFILD